MKKVFIIVLHYKGVKDTSECLSSLGKIFIPKELNVNIVIIDNASNDNLKSLGAYVIRNNNNLGFAGGNNIGIKYALSKGADYILILNNDTIVDKDFLEKLVSSIKNNNKFGIAVPKIYFAKDCEFHKSRYKINELGKVLWYAGGKIDWKNVIGYHVGVDEVDRGQFDKLEETEIATGCCMLVKREVFEKVGMLNEKYFLYYEDSDFSIRTKTAGFKILYVPDSIIWHKNAGSSDGSGSSLQDYYITRNRMIFGMSYSPIRSKLALIRESFRILLFGRKWQKRGILDFYLGRLGRGSYR